MTRARRSALAALAERVGILSSYVDVAGRPRATTSDARRALLAALGVDASTEGAAADALAALAHEDQARLCPPVGVAVPAKGRPAAFVARVPVGGRGAAFRLAVTNEAGENWVRDGRVRGAPGRRERFALARALPPGYYRARIEIAARGGGQVAEQLLVVPPRQCPQPASRLGRAAGYGVATNLYTLRSGRNWGVGDLSDLAALGRWAAACGAAFVGINPLHALLNRDGAVSPYSPVSRLYRNPLYLDPTAVPGFAACAEARAWLAEGGRPAELERLRRGDRVEYAAVMALKRPVLEALHRAAPRDAPYARYAAEQGGRLAGFATYLALADRFGPDWRAWPPEWRRPDGPAVTGLRRECAAEIDYHSWVQYQLDRQLAAAAGTTGLELGFFGDLAIGTAPQGADTWAAPDLFVAGASLGVPPDTHIPAGQDWGLTPLDPRALAAQRFDYWILLLRGALRHMGGLRIDHVMGLFRQFWIPPGGRPADGAFVRYPAEPLLAILALESARAGAVIVGEDLGTVPPGLPATLRRWGILSTRMLYFERQGGGFRAARGYSHRALVTVNTHDHAPLAGFWRDRDIELRHAVGAIPSARALAAARAARARDRAALLRRLAAERLLPRGGASASPAALAAAVHTFLGRTPAPLVGLSLDDLVGETEPVNLPGIGLDRYPSWQRRLALPLERLTTAAGVRSAIGDQRRRARPGVWPAS